MLNEFIRSFRLMGLSIKLLRRCFIPLSYLQRHRSLRLRSGSEVSYMVLTDS